MWLVAAAVGSLFLSAGAQPDTERQRSKERQEIFKKVTEHNFEDGLRLQGKVVGPDGQDIIEYPRPTFNPLILLRQDFRTEMRRSVDEVK